jgi:hypothetical protein
MLNGLLSGLNMMGGHNPALPPADDWVDWTIEANKKVVGWSSLATSRFHYKKIGSLVLLDFNFRGTSNSTLTQIPLPFKSIPLSFSPMVTMNGQNNTVPGSYSVDIVNDATFLSCYTTENAAGWAASGTKQVIIGDFFYFTNE